MSLEVNTSLGPIEVSDSVIANIAGIAAIDCYGLVGMASRNQLKDGITELLGRENLSKGIEVRQVNGEYMIDLYIIVGFGVKISEVAHNVQAKIRYTLEQMLGLEVSQVNIYVQGVRLLSEE
ncbi:Asp23/Gls24 family envelope stress response protein [Thermoflavimicrobium dichotomicum]|nr:Asp23/Gls24 family envelope stress response protein [Thermoflavimicrobium dichotomicum]